MLLFSTGQPCVVLTIVHSNISSHTGQFEDEVDGMCDAGYVVPFFNDLYDFTCKCMHNKSWSMKECVSKCI